MQIAIRVTLSLIAAIAMASLAPAFAADQTGAPALLPAAVITPSVHIKRPHVSIHRLHAPRVHMKRPQLHVKRPHIARPHLNER